MPPHDQLDGEVARRAEIASDRDELLGRRGLVTPADNDLIATVTRAGFDNPTIVARCGTR